MEAVTTWEEKELRPRQPLGLGLWWSLLEKTSVMLNSKASSNTASMGSKCLHSPGQGRYRPCSLCHSSHACPGGSSYLNMLIVASQMYHNTHRPLQRPMATTEAVTVEERQEILQPCHLLAHPREEASGRHSTRLCTQVQAHL